MTQKTIVYGHQKNMLVEMHLASLRTYNTTTELSPTRTRTLFIVAICSDMTIYLNDKPGRTFCVGELETHNVYQKQILSLLPVNNFR